MWIGVDFDGTIAYQVYNRTSPYELGEPIIEMVNRVKDWISKGYEVKLLTARMNKMSSLGMERDLVKMERILKDWCFKHVGVELECTNMKDGWMDVLWDDRAVTADPNTGQSTVIKLKLEIEDLKRQLQLKL